MLLKSINILSFQLYAKLDLISMWEDGSRIFQFARKGASSFREILKWKSKGLQLQLEGQNCHIHVALISLEYISSSKVDFAKPLDALEQVETLFMQTGSVIFLHAITVSL